MLHELRKMCPPIVPVRTRRRPLTGDFIAYTNLFYGKDELPTHFEITIDSRLSWEATWQVLAHEWAHCLAWREGAFMTDHGPEFGLAFAHIWGWVLEP